MAMARDQGLLLVARLELLPPGPSAHLPSAPPSHRGQAAPAPGLRGLPDSNHGPHRRDQRSNDKSRYER